MYYFYKIIERNNFIIFKLLIYFEKKIYIFKKKFIERKEFWLG